MSRSAQRELTVELCLRTAPPGVARGRQESVRERVGALADDGRIADATVSYWSTRVCVPGESGGPADRCPRVVGEILDFARERDVDIEPYFRSRPARHDDERVLFLPVICLLVRRDGELRELYPSTSEGERRTVEDGLDRLEAGDAALH